MLKTLAIETSCDDTSIGIISFDGKFFKTEKLLAYSQIDDHQQYGGVVPEIASRLHSDKIIKVLNKIGFSNIAKVYFISVTTHPGLPGSLVVGKAVANLLGQYYKKPVIEVNHINGHIFSLSLERNINEIKLPMMVLTASGGHNDLYLVESPSSHQVESQKPVRSSKRLDRPEDLIDLKTSLKKDNSQIGKTLQTTFKITRVGNTLDDAAGECFDKVSRMLGGPYPGGLRISQKALKGKSNPEYKFKRIFLSSEKFEFSFSGMKSQVSFLLKKLESKKIKLTEKIICDIAYEFQEAVVEVLAKKLIKAGKKYGAQTLGIAGGVSCNDRLREYLNNLTSRHGDILTLKPSNKVYSTDNAAMIGVAGILKYLENNI